MIAADIIFVVDEKKHPQFERDGNDLITTKVVDLHEALLGTSVFITTLNGKSINVDIPEIVSPKYVKVLVGEGMPLVNSTEQQGGHEDQVRHTVSQGAHWRAKGATQEHPPEQRQYWSPPSHRSAFVIDIMDGRVTQRLGTISGGLSGEC